MQCYVLLVKMLIVVASGRVSRHFDSFTTDDWMGSISASTNRQLLALSITGSILRTSASVSRQVLLFTVTGAIDSCSGSVVMQVVSLTKGEEMFRA